MERLTDRELEDVYLIKCMDTKCADCCDNCEVMIEALERLKAYEDAEEQGLLIRERSEWRKNGALMECQSCGEIYCTDGCNRGKAWDFCPNCGAKMKGGAT